MGQFSFSLDFNLKTFDARMNIIRPGKIAHPIGRAWARKTFKTRPTFQGRGAHFALLIIKNIYKF